MRVQQNNDKEVNSWTGSLFSFHTTCLLVFAKYKTTKPPSLSKENVAEFSTRTIKTNPFFALT